MKWLLTAPAAESRSLPQYVAWVEGGGVATQIVRPAGPLPAAEEFDALLVTGGVDIDPRRYGEPAHAATCDVQPDRDDMELRLVRAFLDARRPVLGICRGLQLIQVCLGGRLIQHVPDRIAPETELHRRADDSHCPHGVVWRSGGSMATALSALVTECNSVHHQAADPAALGAGLTVTATSPHGIIEAIESRDADRSFLSAVQWHPERLAAEHQASGKLRDYWLQQVRAHAAARRR
jgi:putative glutamine amidotransferase